MPTTITLRTFTSSRLIFRRSYEYRDFAVIAGDAKPSQMAEALAWAQAHREWLALKWAELNERG
jgi:hypothetical protein